MGPAGIVQGPVRAGVQGGAGQGSPVAWSSCRHTPAAPRAFHWALLHARSLPFPMQEWSILNFFFYFFLTLGESSGSCMGCLRGGWAQVATALGTTGSRMFPTLVPCLPRHIPAAGTGLWAVGIKVRGYRMPGGAPTGLPQQPPAPTLHVHPTVRRTNSLTLVFSQPLPFVAGRRTTPPPPRTRPSTRCCWPPPGWRASPTWQAPPCWTPR